MIALRQLSRRDQQLQNEQGQPGPHKVLSQRNKTRPGKIAQQVKMLATQPKFDAQNLHVFKNWLLKIALILAHMCYDTYKHFPSSLPQCLKKKKAPKPKEKNSKIKFLELGTTHIKMSVV